MILPYLLLSVTAKTVIIFFWAVKVGVLDPHEEENSISILNYPQGTGAGDMIITDLYNHDNFVFQVTIKYVIQRGKPCVIIQISNDGFIYPSQ